MSKKVLVTGGCGLIGFHAAKYYVNCGYDVTVMDNLERSSLLGHTEVSLERTYFNMNELKKMGVHVLLLDVSQVDSWKGLDDFEYVLHFAGQCGVPTSIQNPRRDMEVNYLGTFNALEYCREVGAALAFASTNKVYPLHDCFVLEEEKWKFNNRHFARYGFPEDGNGEPDLVGARTPYGASKYAADLLCQEWAETYGVKTGVFRMSCIYGPNQFGFEEQGWATWFIIAALKELPLIIYGDGKQTRDMLFVEDCVAAYDAFLSSGVKSGVYNLGGGPSNVLSLNEHIEWLKNVNDGNDYEHTFGDLLWVEGLKYSNWRPLDQKSYVTDIRHIKRELGWEPKVSAYDGLEQTYCWVRDYLKLF